MHSCLLLFICSSVTRVLGTRCCTALQDKKWAEQAYVFPAWEQYQEAVQQRAREAGREWMPSASAGARQQRVMGHVHRQ
jgi:hypothetical protein